MLPVRSAHAALRTGSIAFLDADEPVLAFVREAQGQALLAVFNLSSTAVTCTLPLSQPAQAVAAPGVSNGQLSGNRVELPAHGVLYATLG